MVRIAEITLEIYLEERGVCREDAIDTAINSGPVKFVDFSYVLRSLVVPDFGLFSEYCHITVVHIAMFCHILIIYVKLHIKKGKMRRLAFYKTLR